MLFHATGQNRFDQTFSSLWETLPNYNGSSLHPSNAASVKEPRTFFEISQKFTQVAKHTSETEMVVLI